MKRMRRWSKRSSSLTSPLPLGSKRVKAAWSCSSESMSPESSLSSGSPLQYETNLACLTTPPSDTALTMSLDVFELFFMCAFRTSMAWARKTPAAKSSLSEARGAATSLVVSSFFSSSSTNSVASFIRRCATNLCSCSRKRPFCLSRSAWICVSFSSILPISPRRDCSPLATFASRWRPSNNVRVAPRTLCASCCAVPAFSQDFFISSASTSVPPSMSALVASTAAATRSSTWTTFSETSRFTVANFLSAMHFLASPRRFDTASNLDCIAVSCSVVDLADFSESRLAARRFIARKVFAPPTAEWAACSAASKSLSALLASSTFCSSGVFRKAASASATFPTESSASFTRVSDS
mmetsp:Transcript_49095/g.131395  ORF Transcript_49095/g.131395 Transcript_49095/m.131395 type:complete len:353 (+) Transcript_49095:2455-3513(+)